MRLQTSIHFLRITASVTVRNGVFVPAMPLAASKRAQTASDQIARMPFHSGHVAAEVVCDFHVAVAFKFHDGDFFERFIAES